MKETVAALFLIGVLSLTASAQDAFKFIFVPHIRSEDKTNQTVNPGIAKIDFSKYSLKLLGGDLTPDPTASEATMQYLDSLFDLKNENTLWSVGNHDVESGSGARDVITKYTGRPTYYSYSRDGITFMVLDCELGANGFSGTDIKSPQLDTLKAVCEQVTSDDTKFFILLHSRYMWMIGNSYFTKTEFLDSIAASSKSMTATNWYTDVEPLLQKVKNKGIQVIVFGGDKSKINVSYPDTVKSFNVSSTNNIHYFAARMENTFTDTVNNVIVIDYVRNTSLTCRYVTLVDINKEEAPVASRHMQMASATAFEPGHLIDIRNIQGSRQMNFDLQGNTGRSGQLRFFTLNGALYRSIDLTTNTTGSVHFGEAGIYIMRTQLGNIIQNERCIIR